MIHRGASMALVVVAAVATIAFVSGCTGDDKAAPLSSGTGGTAGASATCGPARAPMNLETSSGTLYGTVQLPNGCAPFPVVLIHAGSGPTDRDGNSWGLSIKNDSLKLLAEGLAERDIASVRFDKRGIAASQSAGPTQETDHRFEMYVEDFAAWTRKVASDPRFSHVTLIGHSEGALIGTLSSHTDAPDAFVSLAGAGRPAADVLREQLGKNLTGALLTEANAILDQLEQGKTVDQVSPDLRSTFRASVQPYLLSWFKYDPAVEFAKLAMPTVIAQGSTDVSNRRGGRKAPFREQPQRDPRNHRRHAARAQSGNPR